MAREYFCAYHSYSKAIEELNDSERGRLFTALLIYSETGIAPELRGNERFIFPLMRGQIDRDNNKYDEKCEKLRNNGKKRGSKQNEAIACNCNQMQAEAPQGKGKGKGKDKGEKEIKDTDVSLSGAEAAPDSSKGNPVISLMLNDRSLHPVYQGDIDRWAELYPAVNVLQELRNMVGWIDGNPKKRKTKAGINRFITGWLAKEQNRGGSGSKALQKPERKWKPLD